MSIVRQFVDIWDPRSGDRDRAPAIGQVNWRLPTCFERRRLIWKSVGRRAVASATRTERGVFSRNLAKAIDFSNADNGFRSLKALPIWTGENA